MWSKCLSELFNLIAALISAAAGAISTFALFWAPEPTGLTKALAIASGIATLGALLWVISAFISFLECLQRTGAQADELAALKAELRRLRERVEALQGQ